MTQPLTLPPPYPPPASALPPKSARTAAWSQALAFAARVSVDPQAHALLGHPLLSPADAVGLLAMDGADEAFTRFLGLLADNRRLALLPEIAGLFEELRAEAERVVKAKITAASELPASELDAIKAALVKRFGREVEVETAIDATLIGGAVIDTGEVVIDGSLKGKLARLQTSLAQ